MTGEERPGGRHPVDRLRFATEREVAPHVDPEWASAVLLELRLRGVPGHHIGEVLAEADAHCVESGEDAQSAFGDAVPYAQSLDLPTEDTMSPRELFPAVVRGTLQALGMTAAVFGVGAWARDEPLAITVGVIAMVSGLLAAELALLRFADRVLRAALSRPAAPAVAFVLAVGAGAAALLLLDHEVATVPGLPVAVAGVLLVAWGQVLVHRAGADAGLSDPIVAPLGGSAAPPRRGEGVLSLMATWSIPLWTVVLVVFTWWLTTLP